MKATIFCIVSLVLGSAQVMAQDNAAEVSVDIQSLTAEITQAEGRVKEIVNQPVTHIGRMPITPVNVFSPGWFHGGAIRPDYDNVDIRLTQMLPYAKFPYVSSDLNPTEMFIGDELEFNPMTKYYYTDRTLPKHRLSAGQMLEINQLYRIIGEDIKQLKQLQRPRFIRMITSGAWLDSPYFTIPLLAALGSLLVVLYKRGFSRRRP